MKTSFPAPTACCPQGQLLDVPCTWEASPALHSYQQRRTLCRASEAFTRRCPSADAGSAPVISRLPQSRRHSCTKFGDPITLMAWDEIGACRLPGDRFQDCDIRFKLRHC